MAAEESLAADVALALDRRSLPFMLVGAAALSVRGVTRGSHDIDFMTTDATVLTRDWSREFDQQAVVQILRGDFADPLIDTVRFSRPEATPVDLVVGKWKWQRDVINRSAIIDVGAFRARVPDVEDMVLLKIDAGSHLDHRDAAQLIDIHGGDVLTGINRRMGEMPQQLRDAWEAFQRHFVSPE